MAEPVRWSSKLGVSWTPVLTFGRRRTELLEWIESNVALKAFLDDDEELGVAIGSTDQRLSLNRRSMSLELWSRSASYGSLRQMADGVYEMLAPRDVTLSHYRGAWSVELDGEYSHWTERLASRAAPFLDGSSFGAVDGALLVDVVSDRGSFQIEFGIVTGDELRSRVSRETPGRIGSGGQGVPLSTGAIANVPAVSLYVDVHFIDELQLELNSTGLLFEQAAAIESHVTELARELAEAL